MVPGSCDKAGTLRVSSGRITILCLSSTTNDTQTASYGEQSISLPSTSHTAMSSDWRLITWQAERTAADIDHNVPIPNGC